MLWPATSKPGGAVTKTFPVRFAPVTLKVREAEAVPTVVARGDTLPLRVRLGTGTTCPLTGKVREVAPVDDTVITPEGEPTGVAPAIRAKSVAEALLPWRATVTFAA